MDIFETEKFKKLKKYHENMDNRFVVVHARTSDGFIKDAGLRKGYIIMTLYHTSAVMKHHLTK